MGVLKEAAKFGFIVACLPAIWIADKIGWLDDFERLMEDD